MATRKRHTPGQVVGKLAQAGRMLGEGMDVAEVCRELQVSGQAYYRWRSRFGGLKADEARRLKDLGPWAFAAARANDRGLPGHSDIPPGGPRSQAVSSHARLRP